MSILGFFLYELLRIYGFFIIVYVLMNILISFEVINNNNRLIRIIMDFFYKIIEPILNKFRNFIPNFGNIDITPIILLIIIKTIQFSILKYNI